MTPAGVTERAACVMQACADSAVRDDLVAGLRAAEQLKAWLDARTAVMVNKLAQIESFPEQTIADTSRCNLGTAGKTKERADTLADAPTLAEALDDGVIAPGHVDAVTRGRKKLDTPEQQAEFIERVEDLVAVAAAGTIESFQRRLDREIRKIQASDGEERLTRQRKKTRLSHWVDDDGMWNLRGRFDPVTGMKLAGTLDRAVQRLFATATPEHCPIDPVEKNKFLNAHALAHLIQHAGTGSAATSGTGRIECVVVIDVDVNPGAGPEVTFPIPVEIPHRVLAELVADATTHTVVVRNSVILHAPGNLDLGRTTRLANRAQRRALRALYSTCAVPGCCVGYDRCKIHHVVWWRNGGRTDLANLLPVCSKHHALIHNDGWVVALGPNRELTITLPDQRIMTTGPPHRSAA